MKQRICVIGAGPSGLSLLHAFRQNPKHDFDIVCYEQQGVWGGLWNFSWRTGTDEHGEFVHNGQYHNLWSNGPKECLEFADYTFEEHFGKAIGSFPPRTVLIDYIGGRATKSNLRPFIKFKTKVMTVSFCKDSGKFTVVMKNLIEAKTSEEKFDYVIVASGHFSVPNVPYIKGFEKFQGRLMHSHDFRNADEFKGLRLLVVGASYSAEDIACQTIKFGAKEAIVCCRNGPGFKWPKGITEREMFTHVDEKKVYWADGSSKEVDAIVLCTGYQHSFPYLPDDMKTKWTNRVFVPKLYKGVVWEDNTQLFFIGMHDQYYSYNLFDVQAFYVHDVITGRIKLPALEEMKKHTQEWVERDAKLKTHEEKIQCQGDYVRMVMAECSCPKFDAAKIDEAFFLWEQHKNEDIATFRDKGHTSVMTGVKQPPNPTPWMQAFDDSIEAFVKG